MDVINDLRSRIVTLESDNEKLTKERDSLKATVWHYRSIRDEQLAALTKERDELLEKLK